MSNVHRGWFALTVPSAMLCGMKLRSLPPAAVLAVAYASGSVPYSYIVAKIVKGVDLREVDTGTVSGTNLYKVAGVGPLIVGGVLDVAKGAVGPALAGDRPALAAVAAGTAVVAHDWSPFLRGAGGRGISPAMGAMTVNAWPGAALLLAGLGIGKLLESTGLGSFVAQAGIVPALAAWRGRAAAATGAAVLLPMWTKRLAGNRRPASGDRFQVYLNRLLFDRDEAPGSTSSDAEGTTS